MTLDEILAALKEHVGDDKEVARTAANALHTQLPSVAQSLIDKGSGHKAGEMKTKVTRLESELAEAKSRADEVQAELDELKAKTPDLAAKEKELEQRWKGKLDAANKKLEEKDAKILDGWKRSARSAFVMELVALNVDPDYASEVLAAKYADRFAFDGDGNRSVLQPGSTNPYAPAEGQDDVKLLAADVLKQVPARYILAGGEGGSGASGNRGGGGSGGAASVKDIVEKKTARGDYAAV